jgi:hypothetical protein
MSQEQSQGLAGEILGALGFPRATTQNVIVGNTGPVNAVGDAPTFVFTQASAAASWSVTHNLGGFPSVTLADPSGNVMIAGVQYINNNQVIVTFSTPVAGSAYLNI